MGTPKTARGFRRLTPHTVQYAGTPAAGRFSADGPSFTMTDTSTPHPTLARIKHRSHQAIVLLAFGPIYLTAVLVFGLLQGRGGVDQATEQFRILIPPSDPDNDT